MSMGKSRSKNNLVPWNHDFGNYKEDSTSLSASEDWCRDMYSDMENILDLEGLSDEKLQYDCDRFRLPSPVEIYKRIKRPPYSAAMCIILAFLRIAKS